MKAIITKTLPQTETRPRRIKAYAEGGSRPHTVTITHPQLDQEQESHRAAAQALCDQMNWTGKLAAGGLPDQSGYAFCFIAAASTRNEYPDRYKVNQLSTLTDPGAYQYAMQIRSNANQDSTTWINITQAELELIRALWE